jgi:hypothetical protein
MVEAPWAELSDVVADKGVTAEQLEFREAA